MSFICCCLVAKSCSTLQPHELQHARRPCPSLSEFPQSHIHWVSECYPTSSSSVTRFSSCPQFFPTSRSFPVSQLFSSGGQSIGVSASESVLPVNIQGFFPLGLADGRGRLNRDLDTILHVLLRIVSISSDRNPAPLSSFEGLGHGEGRKQVMHCHCNFKGQRVIFLGSGKPHILWSVMDPSLGQPFSTQQLRWLLTAQHSSLSHLVHGKWFPFSWTSETQS